jgi:hypothetical protein
MDTEIPNLATAFLVARGETVNRSTNFMKTETENDTQEAASLHALDMRRVEMRVSGRLLLGVSTSSPLETPGELLAFLKEVVAMMESPAVDDPELDQPHIAEVSRDAGSGASAAATEGNKLP